jgi:hypothetical protein
MNTVMAPDESSQRINGAMAMPKTNFHVGISATVLAIIRVADSLNWEIISNQLFSDFVRAKKIWVALRISSATRARYWILLIGWMLESSATGAVALQDSIRGFHRILFAG